MPRHATKLIIVLLLIGIMVMATACGGPAGEGGDNQGSSQETIKVGWFGPLSGASALLGQDSLRGAQFAIKQFNDAGGLDGKKIELVHYDDRGDKNEAVSIIRRLISRDQVVAIIGGSLSTTSVAAAPIANESKVPMVAAYSNAFEVVYGNEYVWRWASVADVQGYIMAHYLRNELNKEKIAILAQDDEYGQGIARGVHEGVKRWGGEIVFQSNYPIGEKEFRSELTEIQRLGAEVLLSMGFGPSQASVARQSYELGLFPDVQMIASCTADDLNWFNTVGDAGDGVMGTLEFLTGIDTPEVKEFLDKWEEEYDTRIVSHEAGTTYDGTNLLLDAIKRGGATREGIKEALDNISGFKALSGQIHNYTELREPEFPICLSQYNAEKMEYSPLKWYTDLDIIDPRRWVEFYD